MSKFKIVVVILLGAFGLLGNTTYNSSENEAAEFMNPVAYVICDDDGFVTLDIQAIQAEVLANYDGINIVESVVIGTSTGAVIKLNDLSGTITTELVCDFPDLLSDIAVDENGEFYGCDFTSIYTIDQNNCNTGTIPNLGTVPPPNSLSFDTQGNLYFGGSDGSQVYRFDSDESSPPYVWHDFLDGTPSGDFVMLNGKMYISWEVDNGVQLYEVTIDANFNYVSHINLGSIIGGTFGLASELGSLYGIATGQLYRINLDTFTFDTIITNDFFYGSWYGAAGLHEAFDYEISSHASLPDANGDLNPLPDAWTNTQQGGQTIYIRVENTLTGTFEIVEVELIIYSNTPNLTTPTDLTICENENNGIFDLTNVETELLQNVPHAVTVTYHVSDDDATNTINPLDTNYPATLDQETIFVRVQNVANECFSITQFDILRSPNPEIVMPSNLTQCEDIDNGLFILTDVETELLQNNTALVTVTYYTSMPNATAGTNAISVNYQIATAGQETIFVRVENDENGCFATTQFEIILNESLQINTPNNITQCEDENNGTFDVTQVETEILANNTQNVSVTYHASLSDATTSTNALNTNYTASTTNDTIYVRVQSTDNDCFAITQFDVITIENLNITMPSNLTLCEGENNGLFTLTDVESELLQNVTQNVSISYHNSIQDANTNINPIATNYTLTSGQTTIYMRINNTSTACFQTTQFTVQVLGNPIIEPMVNSPSDRLLTDCYIDTNSEGFFDLNDIYTEIITNGNANYTLEFYLSESDAEQEINNIDSIYYTLQVEELFVTATNDAGCRSITNFYVNPDCYETVVDISNIYFPGFFTPNNDAANDTWNVRGISVAVQQTAIIYIFDRYGKLLYYFRPEQNAGWDGTYRGKQVPSNDYWYRMEMAEGQNFSGSFSLIR